MLCFMGSQRVRHNWASELNWTNEFEKQYAFLLRNPLQNIYTLEGENVHYIIFIIEKPNLKKEMEVT